MCCAAVHQPVQGFHYHLALRFVALHMTSKSVFGRHAVTAKSCITHELLAQTHVAMRGQAEALCIYVYGGPWCTGF